MREIVAVRIWRPVGSSFITADPLIVVQALEANMPVQFLERGVMNFMAACDLGPQWEQFKNAPVLFRLDKEGRLVTDASNT